VNQHRPRGREVGRILRHAQVVFVDSTCDEIKYAEQGRREYIWIWSRSALKRCQWDF